MPTATATTVAEGSLMHQLPLKAGISSSTMTTPSGSAPTPTHSASKTSTSATLRSLYNRAGRAFILRDLTLTTSLIQSAFSLLAPPSNTPDLLADQRRKWDILRITFESTVYTSPPPTETIPESLRIMLSESPHSLSSSIYNRSLSLFTPSNGHSTQKTNLNAAYLPSQVLTTLVYCSLKLDAADVGRVMIEDWLACREPHYSLDGTEGEGYAKILDLYCVHILPRLEQWEYAREFLEYENELPERKRDHLRTTLNSIYVQAMASKRPSQHTQALTASESTSPRSYSPAPSSSSSSSSSLSTTSTHTVVPRNRSFGTPSALSTVTPSIPSAGSISSEETTTPRARTSITPSARTSRPHSKSRTVSSSASEPYSSLPRSLLAHQTVSTQANPPGIYALLRASLVPYLTRPKVATFLLLFVLVPLIPFVLRMRRRRQQLLGMNGVGMGLTAATAAAAASASNAELVRRRLQAAGTESGLIQRAWGEVVRVVGDTVRMAGSGLV